jgi:hypothetical protein
LYSLVLRTLTASALGFLRQRSRRRECRAGIAAVLILLCGGIAIGIMDWKPFIEQLVTVTVQPYEEK